jgi:hypothetical protein
VWRGPGGAFSSLANLVYVFQCGLKENLFLSYRFTYIEKDLKKKLAVAAAVIIECLLVSALLFDTRLLGVFHILQVETQDVSNLLRPNNR